MSKEERKPIFIVFVPKEIGTPENMKRMDRAIEESRIDSEYHNFAVISTDESKDWDFKLYGANEEIPEITLEELKKELNLIK